MKMLSGKLDMSTVNSTHILAVFTPVNEAVRAHMKMISILRYINTILYI